MQEMWQILADLGFKIKYFVNFRNPPVMLIRRKLVHGLVHKMNISVSEAIKDPKLNKLLNYTLGHVFLER